MENNKEIKSYAGFTIGPIYEVLSSARKTRELWFASYFFSWFMEKTIETLSKNNDIEFLMPFVEVLFKPNTSITGKYHDRFILKSYLDKEQLFEEIQKASDKTLRYFVDLIDDLVTKSNAKYINGANKNSIEDILKWYIQRNFVVLDKNSVEEHKIIKTINTYLDSMEENRSFATGINKKTCFICKTLPAVVEADIWVKKPGSTPKKEKKELCPLCFVKYYCGKSEKVTNKIGGGKTPLDYPSVPEISAVELLTEDVKKQIPALKSYEKDFDFDDIEQAVRKTHSKEDTDSLLKKSYFKYFAIIQADGDNLGKVLGNFTNFDDIASKFSKPLFKFAEEAGEIIEKYKGCPVYTGGDDILAFAPVAFKNENNETKTVIDLAVELSNAYGNIIGNSGTTLSIGINIAYYKFPLSIALKNARKQLNDKAKTDDKNALALLLTKHSGHQIGFKFKFGNKDIELFRKLLSKTLGGDIDFPHSIHHNLSRFKGLISHIPDKNRLDAFFEKNFNEPVHSKTKTEKGIKEVKNYFEEVMFEPLKKDKLHCVEDILSKLAFIKFLRGEK